MKAGVALVLLALAASSPARASCQLSVRTFFGWDSTADGTITKGSPCVLRFSASRGGGISSVRISEPPQHGRATASGTSVYPEVSYKPNPGFKGEDAFTYVIDGGGKNNNGASHVRIRLTIQ